MSEATDELVDVIAEALDPHADADGGEWCTCESPYPYMTSEHLARAVLAALVSRYGEPEIEHDPLMVHPMDLRPKNYLRRLVFPWKAVKEGDEG